MRTRKKVSRQTCSKIARKRKIPKMWVIPESKKDVHTEHCCILHGCKYGEDDYYCTVATGRKPQSYPCESCNYDGIQAVETIQKILAKQIQRCPYCAHVLP